MPDSSDNTVNSFRRKRGRLLAARIASRAKQLGRPLIIADVGGRRDYWDNVGFEGIANIVLLNIDPSELGRKTSRPEMFSDQIGDACDLNQCPDGAFDFYHSNSVIEHVGAWGRMHSMAREARRVAKAGWIQTPAWEFPVEPHFRLPFLHWFATPVRTALIRGASGYGSTDKNTRRMHAERINLVSKGEMHLLFPDCEIYTEWMIFPKSYVAMWG